jgi:hypothetical protein
MALREHPLMLAKHASRSIRASPLLKTSPFVRSSTNAAADLEQSSLAVPPPNEEITKSFDPVARARTRKQELPPSRWVTHVSQRVISSTNESQASNTVLLIMTAAHYTLIVLLQCQILPLVSSSRALSLFPVSLKPTTLLSPLISWR